MEGREAKYNFEVDTGAMTEMLSDLILIRCEGQPSESFEERHDLTYDYNIILAAGLRIVCRRPFVGEQVW